MLIRLTLSSLTGSADIKTADSLHNYRLIVPRAPAKIFW